MDRFVGMCQTLCGNPHIALRLPQGKYGRKLPSVRGLWDRIRTPLTALAAGTMIWFVLRGAAPLESGEQAPEFEIETDEGRFSLGGSGVTVVNFWGTYCAPCRAEAPVLSRAHDRLQSRGGRVLGLSTDRAPLGDVVASARNLGMRFPIGVATDEILSRYQVERLPTTYVVTADGRVAASFVGAVSEQALDRAIRSADVH